MARRQPTSTHYDELGVHPTATPAEIRAGYLDLARRHHPDRLSADGPAQQAEAASRMARINAAWAVLSDDAARRSYDASIGLDAPSAATIRATGDTWIPLDDDDHLDPALLDDTPTGTPNIPRALTLLPAVFGLAAMVVIGMGVIMTTPAAIALGAVLGGTSVLTFVLAPVLAMINSARDDRVQE